jgi:hypothetical protein
MSNHLQEDHSEQEQVRSQRKVVEAHEFRLLGPEDELRAWFRTVEGIGGKTRTVISVHCLNEQMDQLSIIAEDGGEIIMQFINPDAALLKFGLCLGQDGKMTPAIEIGDLLTSDSAFLRLSVEGDLETPSFALHDRKGTKRALLCLSPEGRTQLILFDENGEEEVRECP